MRFLITTSIFLLPLQFLLAQNEVITLTNPSFEGIAHAGEVGKRIPEGWYDCSLPGETPPDVHPVPGSGAFGVTKPAYDGETYLGLVARDNDTWEGITHRLDQPLQAGARYEFSIYLCRSELYLSASRTTNQPVNYASPLLLRIWGGDKYCDKSELLATSELVTNTDWKKFDFKLAPSKTFAYLHFEAYYKTPTPFPYNGNLLLDNASAIKMLAPAIPLTEADRHEFSRPLMGTDFRIVAYYPDSVKLKEAVEKAYARAAALQKVFSDYEANSEVTWLSDAGKLEDVSDELWDVTNYALDVSQRSEGTFDISVGALSKLWRRAFRDKEFPSQRDLNHAAATVGYEAIKLKDRNKTIKLEIEGMRLDFGGIAAGYAVDEAMAWLNEYGIHTALVDCGGDILLGQAPPGKKGWEIEVPDKFIDDSLAFKKLYLANTAITTSGDTYRYLEHEGKRYSHIIDPRTGLGLTNRRVVTVTAPTCIAADAWATAACVGIKKLLMVDLREEGIKVTVLEK